MTPHSRYSDSQNFANMGNQYRNKWKDKKPDVYIYHIPAHKYHKCAISLDKITTFSAIPISDCSIKTPFGNPFQRSASAIIENALKF